ncbi:tRNA dimethylallyltransferase [Nocardioides luteus]|uniref:tRNA dimethylallyltransferase n=1 Tax=Nocardioides luteus TaxID=1844 RepID=A0ABQ5T2J8_9ACTN|nr:tRNA (adenosine(37)-N6)-dimethylallyltransferase MiaA [Nocardioides luteus]MDR7313674.1 tRNA dimethylallyltransferase [Nocardioides luteus]GGR64104.1 tRNA dimethylallyltransferase [Nocardioides luteus]GLJ70479.1 tRNA dimethylallyltransferase [Nocardioides luteus]
MAVVGATAAGKSSLSLDLAEALDGEIINTDAMQVYRGMDIGTAKLPVEERRGIPHHLLDLLDIAEPASVADFQGLARGVIATLREAGKTPVLVGGSALYTRSVLDRFDFPGTSAEIRARLEKELETAGETALHDRLRALDPVSADRIEIDNGRRVVRALEVIELTGEPFSARLPEQVYLDPATIQIGVDIPREALDVRIRQRVAEMFEAGFVDEVTQLLEAGLAQSRTAAKAIGYQEVAAYLAGETTLAEAMDRTVIKTRQFARRQDAWFRKDPRVVWVSYDDPDRVHKAVTAVRALVG